MAEVKNSIHSQNVNKFENCVEVHMKHIQSGLSQVRNYNVKNNHSKTKFYLQKCKINFHLKKNLFFTFNLQLGNLHAFMKSANSGAPTPTKNSSNVKQEDKYSHRLYQSHQQNSNGKGKKENHLIIPQFVQPNSTMLSKS